jgi:hypothetical protein
VLQTDKSSRPFGKRKMSMLAPRTMLHAFIAGVGLLGSAVAHGVAIPNGNFDTLYKPGSTSITATSLSGGYTVGGIGSNEALGAGVATFSDSTTGSSVDIPGWTGPAATGVQEFQPSAGQFPSGTDTLPYGVYVQGPDFGGGNLLVTSASSLGTIATNASYTLTIRVGWRNDINPPAAPIVLNLNGNGVALTPDVSVSPTRVQGTFVTYSRTYDAASLTSFLGQSLTISFGVGASASGQQAEFDTVTLDAVTPEPASLGMLGLGAFGLLSRRRRA